MKSMAQRIADRVLVAETGCWLWTGATASNGYGSVRHASKGRSAHAAAYEEFVGPVPTGKVLMHTCDCRVCVNPAHLKVGTHADNSADMVDKGRACRGERRSGRLTYEDVDAIRSMCASGLPQWLVGKLYSISQTHVSSIVRRATWDDWASP